MEYKIRIAGTNMTITLGEREMEQIATAYTMQCNREIVENTMEDYGLNPSVSTVERLASRLFIKEIDALDKVETVERMLAEDGYIRRSEEEEKELVEFFDSLPWAEDEERV